MSMSLVFQTKFNRAHENGNCLRACVASVLGIDIDSMPAFEDMDGGAWKRALVDWAKCSGYVLNVYSGDVAVNSPYLAIGLTSLGGKHCCVYKKGVLIHDPDPSGDGLIDVKNTILVSKAEGSK